VEGGERGDTIERPADGGSEGLDADPGARRRRVGKLPRYVLSRRAWFRGRGVRFILHAEGRVANCGINRIVEFITSWFSSCLESVAILG